MKILFFIDSLRLGGKERQIVELVKGLSRRVDVQLLLICMGSEDFYLNEIKECGIQIKYLLRNIRWDPKIFFYFFKLVYKFQPDIIHTDGMMTTFYAMPTAKILKIKIVNGSIRNAFVSGHIKWKIEKILLLMSDCRIANSKAGLKSRNLSLQSKRNHVVYNGFDFNRIREIPNREIVKLSMGIVQKYVVGMVAEFSDYKDFESFILAAKEVLKKRNDSVFLCVGNGKNIGKCMEIANLNSKIIFLGARKDVETVISIFDIGVLSTFSEGISNSVIEYMALGKPAIVTTGGGSAEIVDNHNTGFLIPQRNVDVLSNSIMYLLDHPHHAKEMGINGQKRIMEKFSIELLIKKTLTAYKQAIGDCPKNEM
jgi:glycosyltransferase involved in cell wall biosynthesis